MQNTLLKVWYSHRRLSKYFKKHRPSRFFGQDYINQKEPGTTYYSLLKLQIIFKNIPFSLIYHLNNFDALVQSCFWVIPKIAYANLCKPAHDVIIIPVSTVHLKLKHMKRKEKNSKKFKILRKKRAFQIKLKAFFIIFERLPSGKI